MNPTYIVKYRGATARRIVSFVKRLLVVPWPLSLCCPLLPGLRNNGPWDSFKIKENMGGIGRVRTAIESARLDDVTEILDGNFSSIH